MKKGIFTYILALVVSAIGANAQEFTDLSQDLGNGWGNDFSFTSEMVINEDFKGFEFFHTDANPDQGNSDNKLDEATFEIIPGYKDLVTTNTYLNSSVEYTYTFDSCAFAPEWATTYVYKTFFTNDETQNTPNVSNGFVEISRNYPTSVYGEATSQGWFTIDLSDMTYVEGIQYSVSANGKKRGFLTEISIDGGASWDSLRFQGGGDASYINKIGAYYYGYYQDPSNGFERTYNNYRLDNSWAGSAWEDGIYIDNSDGSQPVKIRFTVAIGQTPRIHDLKVYGEVPTAGINDHSTEFIQVNLNGDILSVSEISEIELYNTSGSLVATESDVESLSLKGLPTGIYIVKVNVDAGSVVKKIVKK